MAAKRRDSIASFGLRSERGMKNELGVKRTGGFCVISRRICRADAKRAARAFFRDGRNTALVAGQLAHHTLRAVMLAVFTAAGR